MNLISASVDVETLSTVLLAVGSFAPGFLIAFFRSKFITGRLKSISEASLEYLIMSSVYYFFAMPIFLWVGSFGYLAMITLFFVAPILTGTFLGILYQTDIVAVVASKFGLKIAHPMPTSWDYLFGNLRGNSWVVVTLKNHHQVYGFFGGMSFASSDLNRRDLYIQDIRDSNWNPLEEDGRARGLWLSEEEICMVEIVTNEVAR